MIFYLLLQKSKFIQVHYKVVKLYKLFERNLAYIDFYLQINIFIVDLDTWNVEETKIAVMKNSNAKNCSVTNSVTKQTIEIKHRKSQKSCLEEKNHRDKDVCFYFKIWDRR